MESLEYIRDKRVTCCKSPVWNRLTSVSWVRHHVVEGWLLLGAGQPEGSGHSLSGIGLSALCSLPCTFVSKDPPESFPALLRRAGCPFSLVAEGGIGGPLERWQFLPRSHLCYLPPPNPHPVRCVFTAGLAGVRRPPASPPGGLKPDLIKT